jgi:hypothetical protein
MHQLPPMKSFRIRGASTLEWGNLAGQARV